MDRSALLEMIQKEHPGYHPILSLARIAHGEDTSLAQQIDCHKTVLKYVEAELKSVDVSGEMKADFGTLRVIMEPPPSDIPMTYDEAADEEPEAGA